ncbi:hypothetical protein [uncultured Bifidobacterium sp.]|uniref:hypothetical protein n=1 Tax=uncultured Bifidobacterium sp. TaxID=165187 RepID=UPI00280B95C5|nr:hypothetical protein [uncultured Bifidobacterium sp.]
MAEAMTNVHFSFKDAQGRPKAGTLHVAPVRRHISGSTVVVLGGFDVMLSADGTATVQLEPTDNTFAWKVSEFPDDTDSTFERVVQVPASSDTVEYTDLVDVDASTLAPALNTGAALTYLLASSLQEAQALSAANPGQMVFYPESGVKTVASQILEDLTSARAVVEDQSAVAAQAANAAQAASVGAQAASVQAADAVQAVSEQTAQVSSNAAAVQSVTDSINESKAVVESHANDALTAIDEAVKSVKDKASDATGDDKAETTADTTDAAADGSQEA